MRSYRLGAAVTLVWMTACGGAEQAEETRFEGAAVQEARAGWPDGLAAMVDSGNTAYREGRLDDAADLFERATQRFPHIGAPWFGLHMAEHARGNLEAADSARVKAEDLTPGIRPESR